jgi:hypothetical protein
MGACQWINDRIAQMLASAKTRLIFLEMDRTAGVLKNTVYYSRLMLILSPRREGR